MKVGLFCYSNSTNVGDFIQTLAVAQHLDQEYHLVDRDFMHEYDGEPMAVVMNGWFTDEPDNWPPSPSIIPVFMGFHISRESAAIIRKHKEYFMRHAPIGCRDHMTAEYMRECGIDAYVSGCATMTFPRRTTNPAAGKVVLVDEPLRNFLRSERRDFVFISHELEPYMSQSLRFQAAKELLDFYRENAGLIITRRIHCAMPCAAMGFLLCFRGSRMAGPGSLIFWACTVSGLDAIQEAVWRLFPRKRSNLRKRSARLLKTCTLVWWRWGSKSGFRLGCDGMDTPPT